MARKIRRIVFVLFIFVGLFIAAHKGSEYGTSKAKSLILPQSAPSGIDQLPPGVEPPLPLPTQLYQSEGKPSCDKVIASGPLSVIGHVLSVYAGFPNASSNRDNVAILAQLRRDDSISEGLFNRTSQSWLNTTYKATLAVSATVSSCEVGERSTLAQQLLINVKLKTTDGNRPDQLLPYSVDVVRLHDSYMVTNIGPQQISVSGGGSS